MFRMVHVPARICLYAYKTYAQEWFCANKVDFFFWCSVVLVQIHLIWAILFTCRIRLVYLIWFERIRVAYNGIHALYPSSGLFLCNLSLCLWCNLLLQCLTYVNVFDSLRCSQSACFTARRFWHLLSMKSSSVSNKGLDHVLLVKLRYFEQTRFFPLIRAPFVTFLSWKWVSIVMHLGIEVTYHQKLWLWNTQLFRNFHSLHTIKIFN